MKPLDTSVYPGKHSSPHRMSKVVIMMIPGDGQGSSGLQGNLSFAMLRRGSDLGGDAAGTCGVGSARVVAEKAVFRQARKVVWCRPHLLT